MLMSIVGWNSFTSTFLAAFFCRWWNNCSSLKNSTLVVEKYFWHFLSLSIIPCSHDFHHIEISDMRSVPWVETVAQINLNIIIVRWISDLISALKSKLKLQCGKRDFIFLLIHKQFSCWLSACVIHSYNDGYNNNKLT